MKWTGLALGLIASALWGSSTTTWEMTSYSDFLKGRFSGVSLTRDGRLMLAPKLETLFASEQPVIWSIARAQDGTLYAGTGHKGRVYRIDSTGKSALLWSADQPEVFAVAVDAKGAVFAGTSPDGKVYRIENGKAEEYYATRAKYIWALTFGPDGALYVGTGDQGKIFRVTGPGKGEVYYDTAQSHVSCLSFDAQGRLLAGSEPNGILYRVTAKDKAFVLYDANLPEIRSIVPGPDGTIYAAALGGSIASRALSIGGSSSGGFSAPVTTSTGTSITVTDAQAGIEIKPKQEQPKAPPAQQSQVTTQITPILDMSGVEKSALYRINPDNTVETLWSSKEENIYDVLLNGNQLVFATDLQGRIYRLTQDRKATLIVQTNENETTRLLNADGNLLASTGSMGKIFRMGDGPGSSGYFEAPVHDAGGVARWGRLNWRATKVPGAGLAFRTRSGNSARPDKTWSDWSAPLDGSERAMVTSPNARYLQWRAEFSASGPESQMLDNVTVTYLPQNTPPLMKSIGVALQSSAGGQQARAAAAQSTGSYSITVSDTGDSSSAASGGTPAQTLSRTGAPQLQVSWQAEDTDGDRLIYNVFFRGEEEREWKTLKLNTTDSSLTV